LFPNIEARFLNLSPKLLNYKGWGCIYTVSIFIFKKDTVRDTLYFRMCDNLRLRVGRMKGE
jgi:hypothetical protein